MWRIRVLVAATLVGGGSSRTLAPERPRSRWLDREQQRSNHQPPSTAYFASVAAAGAASCCLTHSAVVPIDVVKTRLQTDASLNGAGAAVRAIISGCQCKGLACVRPFFNGIGATAVGYFFQGAIKFGTCAPHAVESTATAGRSVVMWSSKGRGG